jgi:hypothetical protein
VKSALRIKSSITKSGDEYREQQGWKTDAEHFIGSYHEYITTPVKAINELEHELEPAHGTEVTVKPPGTWDVTKCPNNIINLRGQR